MCWKLVPVASESVVSLYKICRGAFPAFPGTQIQEVVVRTFFDPTPGTQIQEVVVRTFFDPTNGVKHDSNSRLDRKKNYVSIRSPIAIILASFGSKKGRWRLRGPPRSGKQPQIRRFGREIRHVLRREKTFSNHSGAKAHANTLKVLFQPTANPTA